MTPFERRDVPKLIVIAIVALALIAVLVWWLS
jgi:hypothetical protein